MSDGISNTATVAAGQLRAFVERIERLEEDKREVAEAIKEVFSEAKGQGFDVKTLRKVIARRKKKPEERSEEEAMLDLYETALGMQPTLGQWAEAVQEVRDGGVRDRLRSRVSALFGDAARVG